MATTYEVKRQWNGHQTIFEARLNGWLLDWFFDEHQAHDFIAAHKVTNEAAPLLYANR